MSVYSLTDLGSKIREVADAAVTGPVELTTNGKRRFVLLSAEHFDQLKNAADTRVAYHVADLPPALADEILEALTRGPEPRRDRGG